MAFPFPRRRVFDDPDPTFSDVAYGNDSRRQVLDYWAPPERGERPAPLLIFFHGGGFVRGSKYFCRQMREVRRLGAAVIAVNYQFVRWPGSTVAAAMEDGLRVMDFVRERAEEWHIDPDRVALHGKSSGGAMALWLAMQESVRGVTTHNTPTSFDPQCLEDFGRYSIHAYLPIWAPMADTLRASQLGSERIEKLIARYSPVHQVHASSPPLYLHYTRDQPEEGAGWLHTFHCAGYGELMKRRYDELGLSCELAHPSAPAGRGPLEFLCDVLDLEHS